MINEKQSKANLDSMSKEQSDGILKVDIKSNQDLLLNILEKLDTMQSDIAEIKNDISIMKEELCEIQGQTKHMDDHIEFVETIYDVVHKPVEGLCNAYNALSYATSFMIRQGSTTELPSLENGPRSYTQQSSDDNSLESE